jgi:hypothetical protein
MMGEPKNEDELRVAIEERPQLAEAVTKKLAYANRQASGRVQ